MRVQALGICRFSMLVESDFQTTGADLDANRRILYDADRMAERFRWFENLCLPPLMAQTDPDFTLVLATGEDLPQQWLTRLREIAAEVPQIRLMQAAPGRHAPICKAMLAAHLDPRADVVAQFRMDDDDAVALDFVESLRRDFPRIAGLMQGPDPVALDYARGLVLERGPDGCRLTEEMQRLWVPALVMFFPGGMPRSIMNYRHDHMWHKVPVVSLIDRVMWIRGFHDTNDSPRPPDALRPRAAGRPDLNKLLRERFGLQRGRLFRALMAG